MREGEDENVAIFVVGREVLEDVSETLNEFVGVNDVETVLVVEGQGLEVRVTGKVVPIPEYVVVTVEEADTLID